MTLLDRFNDALQCDAADTDPLHGAACTYGDVRAVARWARATRQAAVGLPETWNAVRAFVDTNLKWEIPEVNLLLRLADQGSTAPPYHRFAGDLMMGDYHQLRAQLYNLVVGIPHMARADTYYAPRDVVRAIRDNLNAQYWEHV